MKTRRLDEGKGEISAPWEVLKCQRGEEKCDRQRWGGQLSRARTPPPPCTSPRPSPRPTPTSRKRSTSGPEQTNKLNYEIIHLPGMETRTLGEQGDRARRARCREREQENPMCTAPRKGAVVLAIPLVLRVT